MPQSLSTLANATATPGRTMPRLALLLGLVGLLLLGVFMAVVLWSRGQLRNEIHRRIVERDAAVLYSVAMQQLADSERTPQGQRTAEELLSAVLRSSEMKDYVFAVTVFDVEGRVLRSLPATLLFAEMPPRDYPRLLGMERISRYHEKFPLARYFSGVPGDAAQQTAPVLEILLPLPGQNTRGLLGFAQYFIDARPIARELTVIDEQIQQQTLTTLTVGGVFLVAILLGAYYALERAQRTVAERNARLARANFELALAAKVSALGQITSHLMHGLQGSVAGLRTLVAGRSLGELREEDLRSAEAYTERLQGMIAEALQMLSDTNSPLSYELSSVEIAAIIRTRNASDAERKGLQLSIECSPGLELDNHRGSLICLIASNLIQNAIQSTPAGRRVEARLGLAAGEIKLTVTDEGPGIPAEMQERLFRPGASGRDGGTGLGLAISHLLSRQMNGDLTLVSTGPRGTEFQLIVPL